MDSLELFGEILEPCNWDEECDREVAAVTWKVETQVPPQTTLKTKQEQRKYKINKSGLSKKVSISAPHLELPKEPREPPLLYGCRRCPFLCTDKNFLVAHTIIEHEESCEDFSIGVPQEVIIERNEFAKKIIAVVKHVILESITRARCDTEIILEEADEDQLASMNELARSIVNSAVTVVPEAASSEQTHEQFLNSSIGSERDLEEMLPSQGKRRKKAQPRKLQIADDENSNDTRDLNSIILCQVSDEPNGEIQIKLSCPLCHQQFDCDGTLKTHLEDIHMSWISPEKTVTVFTENNIPIVPFSSMSTSSTSKSSELEPWRKKHARNCNKRASGGSRSLQCSLCNSKTKMSLSEFKTHMVNNHHYRRAFCCHECGGIFEDLGCFVEHTSDHIHEPFVCEICDLTFTSKKEQNEHRRGESHQKAVMESVTEDVHIIYEDASPIKCPSCEYRCHQMRDLERHLKEESHYHPCQYQGCEGFFRSKQNLDNHISISHKGNGVFLCDFCGKSFRLHATLLRHKNRNHNVKNVKKCDFCGAQFNDNYKLQRHIRSLHSKEKPYKCDECGKAFARKDKLQDHKWSHSKSRMFVCHVCDRAYLRPDCLKAHERIHLIADKMECHFCSEKFETKTIYGRHMRDVHDIDIDAIVKRKSKGKRQKQRLTNTISEEDISNDILVSAIASQLSIPDLQSKPLEELPIPNFTLTVKNERLTDLQPVEVLVGGSGAVQSIHPVNLKFPKPESVGKPNDSNSCSPTVLHPVDDPVTPQYSLADESWADNDPSIFFHNRPSMVSVDSKFIDRPHFLCSPKSE